MNDPATIYVPVSRAVVVDVEDLVRLVAADKVGIEFGRLVDLRDELSAAASRPPVGWPAPIDEETVVELSQARRDLRRRGEEAVALLAALTRAEKEIRDLRDELEGPRR